jgi:hypothetical protein
MKEDARELRDRARWDSQRPISAGLVLRRADRDKLRYWSVGMASIKWMTKRRGAGHRMFNAACGTGETELHHPVHVEIHGSEQGEATRRARTKGARNEEDSRCELTGQCDTARVQNPFALLLGRHSVSPLFPERCSGQGDGDGDGDGGRGRCGRDTVGT